MSVRTKLNPTKTMEKAMKMEMQTSAKDILNAIQQLETESKTTKQYQQYICEHIKNKIKTNKEMELLQEKILEDGSVVLTLKAS